MKKKLRSILLGLMLIVSIFGLVACDEIGKVDTSVKNLTVTFIVDDATYQTVKTDNSSEITIPSEPTKEGFDFDGWYLDDEIWEKPFTLNTILDTPISDSLSVYAKWKVHEHKFEKSLTADETYHWYKSTCEHTDVVKDKVEHNYNGGDVCVDCGYNKTTGETEHVHTFSETLTFDDTYHWYQATCEHISEIKEKVKHNYLNYVFNNDATYEQDGTETGACVCGKTNTRTKENSKLVHGGVSFKTLTLGSNNEACGVVANGTESFNFINEIETSGTATFGVYLDEYCSQAVKTKIAPLSVGDNVFYIYVENTDNGDIIYNVTIRVKPLYEVTFNTLNGTAIASQSIEEGNTASKPIKDLTRTGYIFKGWNYDFSTPITSNVTINVNTWQAITYKVKYDDNGATSGSMQEETYTYDQIYTLATNVFEKTGYTFNGWSCNGTAYTDGQSVKNLSAKNNAEITLTAQWQVNQYNVKITNNKSYGELQTSVVNNKKCDYDTEITLNVLVNVGYIFEGWYDGENLLSNELEYTFNLPARDIEYSTKWRVDDAFKNFNFSSTPTTCTISGVKDKNIIEIIVPYGVTIIEDYVFESCYKLIEVINKSNLNITVGSIDYGYVGYYAKNIITNKSDTKFIDKDNYKFYNDNGIYYLTEYVGNDTNLILPNDINGQNYSIYRYAFYNCNTIERITIPNSIINIGEKAFYNCYKVLEVINKSNLSIITGSEDNGYVGYYARQIITDESQSNFIEEDGYIFYNDNETYYLMGYNGTDTDLVLPNDINGQNYSIYRYAFYNCNTIERVTISNNVTFIGDFAFYGCTSLTEVKISNSVNSIRKYAFYDCSSLTSVMIEEGVTTIGEFAFYNCKNLTEIIIPASVTEIGSSAFGGCSSLYSMTLPFVGKYKIVSYSDNTILFGYIFGTSSYTGGEATKQSNSSTSTITYYIPSTLKNVKILGGNLYYGAFSNCRNIESISLEEGITRISYRAFYFCSGIKNLEIPNSISYIEKSAFENSTCYSQKVYYQNAWYIGNSRNPYVVLINVSSKSIDSITVNENCRIIEEKAFSDCYYLSSITIPNSVRHIGDNAFNNCENLEEVNYKGTFDEWVNINFERTYGYPLSNISKLYLLNKDTGNYEEVTEVIIKDSTTISAYAFGDCENIKSIVLSDCVKSIGKFAFNSNLEKVYYNGTLDQWLMIDFENASANPVCFTKKLYLLNKEKNEYEEITEVNLTTVPFVYNYAFYNFNSLTSIVIGNSLKGIYDYAFDGCNNLNKVYYNGTREEWAKISIETGNSKLIDATRYYYSKTKPMDTTGNYWHYVDGVVTEW